MTWTNAVIVSANKFATFWGRIPDMFSENDMLVSERFAMLIGTEEVMFCGKNAIAVGICKAAVFSGKSAIEFCRMKTVVPFPRR